MTEFTCPDAPIVAVHEEPGWRRPILIASVRCPHCARVHVHVHGVGARGDPVLGHRLAHCIPSGTDTYTLHSYVLVDTNGLLP
jgi:hypothetical protein